MPRAVRTQRPTVAFLLGPYNSNKLLLTFDQSPSFLKRAAAVLLRVPSWDVLKVCRHAWGARSSSPALRGCPSCRATRAEINGFQRQQRLLAGPRRQQRTHRL